MEIKEHLVDNVVVFTLEGSLHSEADAQLLRERVYTCLARHQVHVVFDLKDLRYINSWGLGLLVAILSMLRKEGGDLRLVNLGEHVHSLFIVTQLSQVVKTFDDVGAAVKSFRSHRA